MVGQYRKGSQDLHCLLKQLAEAKVLQKARATGEPPCDHDVGLVLSHFRRLISTTAVRAQATCLLTRIGHLSGAAREAAQRRTLAVRREATLRDESRAFFQTHVRGRKYHR